jgi:hypothetical protein
MAKNGDVGQETCPALSVPDNRISLFHDRSDRMNVTSVRMLVFSYSFESGRHVQPILCVICIRLSVDAPPVPVSPSIYLRPCSSTLRRFGAALVPSLCHQLAQRYNQVCSHSDLRFSLVVSAVATAASTSPGSSSRSITSCTGTAGGTNCPCTSCHPYSSLLLLKDVKKMSSIKVCRHVGRSLSKKPSIPPCRASILLRDSCLTS